MTQLSFLPADKTNSISDAYTSEASVTLLHGDRLRLLDQIDNSGDKAQLIVTSPPYNVGKEYEKKIAFDTYIQQQEETIRFC